jgi:predicted HTH domain antitoxin
MAAAAKLYELGELSSGAAAELAGIPKPIFLSRLADYGVDNFTYDAASLKREIRFA